MKKKYLALLLSCMIVTPCFLSSCGKIADETAVEEDEEDEDEDDEDDDKDDDKEDEEDAEESEKPEESEEYRSQRDTSWDSSSSGGGNRAKCLCPVDSEGNI